MNETVSSPKTTGESTVTSNKQKENQRVISNLHGAINMATVSLKIIKRKLQQMSRRTNMYAIKDAEVGAFKEATKCSILLNTKY